MTTHPHDLDRNVQFTSNLFQKIIKLVIIIKISINSYHNYWNKNRYFFDY